MNNNDATKPEKHLQALRAYSNHIKKLISQGRGDEALACIYASQRQVPKSNSRCDYIDGRGWVPRYDDATSDDVADME